MEEKKELKVINVIDVAKKLWARKNLWFSLIVSF